jgi:hypothetical protein
MIDTNRESIARLLQLRVNVLDAQIIAVRAWAQPDKTFIEACSGGIYELLSMAKYLGIELNFPAQLPKLPHDYPWGGLRDATGRRTA